VSTVTKAIRVALVNDYMIVLEGLRSLLCTEEPGIRVVEVDVGKGPKRTVDVTLLDTFGEVDELPDRVRSLASDSDNGAVVVFSFSDQPQVVREAMNAGAHGFISKAVPGRDIVGAIRACARGERVVLARRSQHASLDESLKWPGRDIGLTHREGELLALRHLYAKLQVRNRVQAATLAEQGILGDHRRQTKPVR
jgi:NarL family two-component system response regulator LiaR